MGKRKMTPIPKMFVKYCSCKFYHNMPSKLYECIAKQSVYFTDERGHPRLDALLCIVKSSSFLLLMVFLVLGILHR